MVFAIKILCGKISRPWRARLVLENNMIGMLAEARWNMDFTHRHRMDGRAAGTCEMPCRNAVVHQDVVVVIEIVDDGRAMVNPGCLRRPTTKTAQM